MSKTREEYWMEEASKFEGWFYRANYMRVQQEIENTKLRELIIDMYEMAWPECPSAFEEAFVNRMRELGLEVGNGVEAQV